MKIQLSFAMARNPRNRAIFDGAVAPEGIDLVCADVYPSELFWRQLRFAEFDVSEMSLSSFLIAVAGGDDRFIGLPVFTTRRFFHTTMYCRRDAGIDGPKDLRDKRVGVPEFQQTAALWARGALKHEFGVDQTEIEWWMERTPEHSHGGATGSKPPPGTTINQIHSDSNIGSMLVSGELDATLLWFTNDANMIDRTTIDVPRHPDIKPVFADRLAEGIRYYGKTGIYPINHLMVIRRTVAERHPWAVTAIYKAMVEANEVAERERMDHLAYHLESGLLAPDQRAAVETRIVTHGLAPNRATIEAAAQYSFEQGLTPRLMKMDEVFAPALMDE